MNNKSTYGLGFEKLKQLLSLGTGCSVPVANPCDSVSLSLREYLDTPLGQVSDPMKPLLRILESKGAVGDLKGLGVIEILLNPNTGIDILRIIKTYGKEMSNTGKGKLEPALGTTLYHAAIASALVFHKEKITSSDNLKLETVFTLLASKEWTHPEIKQLYEQANVICGQKES